MPPLWLVVPAAAYALLIGLLVVGGARWQSVKPRAAAAPVSPTASPEEGTRS
jgi:hypothetical protein